MRVPVKLLGFVFCLFSLNFAQSQEVTCELKSTTFGVTKIKPEGKTIFRAGERVEITCTDEHWFYSTKENIQSFTCGENGKWDYDPVCAEFRCQVPRGQHVYNPNYYFWGEMRLGVKKSYYCVSGYDKMSSEATCTRDGWTPDPLCAVTCAAPNIPNAEIVGDRRRKYIINSRIQYKCRPGFEPEQPVEITCISRDKWSGIWQCTAAKQKSCRDLSVGNGLIHSYSSNEEEIFYTCNTGYKPFTGNWWASATCSKGSWTEEPQCIREEECGAFPSVHHGKVKQTKKTFRDGDTTAFECDPGFISTPRFITCVRGSWEKPVCEVSAHCDIPPKVENAFITSKPEEYYVDGSSVTYACRRLFLMNGKSTVFCRNKIWEETPTCEEATCPLSTTVEELKMERDPDIEGPVKYGHKLMFSCNGQGLILKGQSEITCQPNGEWSSPFPTCVRGKCGTPPLVESADTKEMTKPEYNSGEKVEYICFNKYTLDERHPYSKYLTCEQGEWRGNIKCLKPCSVTVEEMDKRGIELRWRGREKIFSSHLDRISFVCQRGKKLIDSDNLLIQYCNDGEMNLPECV